jgi:putative phosphonate metabolism protein
VTRRHAIYWTPEPAGPLGAFGAAWLGRDPALGRDVPRLALPEIGSDELGAATASPRIYGLHATLKPPFVLKEGRSEAELEERLAAFAARRAPVEAPPLALRNLKGFLALLLTAPCPAVHALADDAVRAFDDLRAPPPAEEMARRRRHGLTERQEAHLVRWGYPGVFEDFTFHVTLTERLGDTQRARFETALAPLVAPFCGEPWRLDAVSLMRHDTPGAGFVLVRRLPLGG